MVNNYKKIKSWNKILIIISNDSFKNENFYKNNYNTSLNINKKFKKFNLLEKFLSIKNKKLLIIKYMENFNDILKNIIFNKLKNSNFKNLKILIITKKLELIKSFYINKSIKIFIKKKIKLLKLIKINRKNKYFIFLKNIIKISFLKKIKKYKYFFNIIKIIKNFKINYFIKTNKLNKIKLYLLIKKIKYDIIIFDLKKKTKYFKKKFIIKNKFLKNNIKKILIILKKFNFKYL